MKVLHVCRTYFPDAPGGVQEAIRQMSLSVRAYGIMSEVFTLSPSPRPFQIELPEARVVRRTSWMSPASCDIGGLSAFLTFAAKARAADLVHFHHPWPFADLLNVTMRVGRPSVLSYHSDIVRQRGIEWAYAPLRRLHFERVGAIVATSPAYLKSSPVLRATPWRDKLAVVPLGLSDEVPDLSGTQSPPDQPYFLFVGALRYYKGLTFLIEAASRVPHQVLICGVGPETESLKAQVRRSGVNNVRFVGLVDEPTKHRLMAQALALVLPSHLRSEAFGVVLVEAAMHGVPMITCEIGTGTSYVNIHEETGLVIAPADPSALASAMRRLVDDAELRRRLGKGARARFLRLFSGDSLGNHLSRLYHNVIGRRPPAEGLPTF